MDTIARCRFASAAVFADMADASLTLPHYLLLLLPRLPFYFAAVAAIISLSADIAATLMMPLAADYFQHFAIHYACHPARYFAADAIDADAMMPLMFRHC